MKNSTHASETSSASMYIDGNTLYIETTRRAWVPAYMYYWMENWNNQSPVKINTVCFTLDGIGLTYTQESLKDKKEWTEVNLDA